MNPVNRAGSISEISAAPLFSSLNFSMFHMRSRAGPVTEISGLRPIGNREGDFPI